MGRNVYDSDFREAATTLGKGLTEEQVAANLKWYEKWDVFASACEEYDRLTPAALRGDIPIPEVPRKFWKGKPMVPHPPKAKMGRPDKGLRVFVSVPLSLQLAGLVEEQRGERSASDFIVEILTAHFKDS